MKRRFFVFFIILFLFASAGFLLAQESQEPPVSVDYQNIEPILDSATGITTYTFTSQASSLTIGSNTFSNVEPQQRDSNQNNLLAFLEIDNDGKIINADLTVSSNLGEGEYVTWTLNGETLRLPAGTRVLVKDGMPKIIHNDQVDSFLVKGEGASEFSRIYPTKDSEITIDKDGWISGDFLIDVSPGFSPVIHGGIKIISEQAVLIKQGSLLEYRDIGLVNKDELLLAVSEEAYNSPDFKNKLLIGPEIKGAGGGYSVNFLGKNQFARFDSEKDVFGIDMKKDAKFILTNRDQEGKIPLLEVDGDVEVTEGSKLFSRLGSQGSDKVMVGVTKSFQKADTYFEASRKTTVPIELVFQGEKSKFLISNYNSIATVPLNSEEGEVIGEGMIFGNSYSPIYSQRVLVDVSYNYPTKKDFEEIAGAKLVLLDGDNGESLNNPINMRRLIDFYETLPEETKSGLKELRIYSSKEFNNLLNSEKRPQSQVAFYVPSGNYIAMKAEEDFQSVNVVDFETFRHEAAHLRHFMVGANIGTEGFSSEWGGATGLLKVDSYEVDINGEPVKSEYRYVDSRELLDSNSLQKGLFEWEDRDSLNSPYKGYLRPYGAASMGEDVATYVETITSDPQFFKREGLIFDGNQNYDLRYKQKIDLLLKYEFISKREYDAIFK